MAILKKHGAIVSTIGRTLDLDQKFVFQLREDGYMLVKNASGSGRWRVFDRKITLEMFKAWLKDKRKLKARIEQLMG